MECSSTKPDSNWNVQVENLMAYIVLIYFSDNFFKPGIFYTKALTGLLELIYSNVATAIFVKI